MTGESAGPRAPDDAIVRFIVDNRDRYTREAMRDQLLAAGHEPVAVDEAFRAADAIARAGPGLDLRPRAAVIAVVAYVIAWVLFGLYLASSGLSASGTFGLLAVYLGLGLLVSLAVISVTGGLRRADPGRVVIALAAGLLVPFVILVGLVGFCIWFIGQLRF